ncbi:related to SCY1 - putative kinase [Melanopsichium pennsylvanicum]|uniref:Other scy1 protein kinase n=2 Tax=Melanopsichium pennsylvanicum TaxID=63383 RepID=A0A077R0J3_9BASI|nr:other scy1 protein kinase [Melanopsichium pennsylvanicum 4]SNX83391.1 related to SCY1 - putative kinase [Melanopsichium pennsylvanicum]
MASFLSQASSYFGRTNISINYTIDDSHQPAHCGLWKIYRATRISSSSLATHSSSSGSSSSSSSKSTVSIWTHTFTTRGQVRTRITEQLKKEASSLTRLRHPCILEVVEPLEESRTDISFATEHVFASLSEALVSDHRQDVQLDEVEIQKGLLQVARGLEFLHVGGKMVHQNLSPESILINAKGDWKLAAFSFLTPLEQQGGGGKTPWTFPDYDPSLPPAMSRNFDYMAPENALDEKLGPENDMYSLGCVVYAVHNKGAPPFRNRNSLPNLRANADRLSATVGSQSWSRMGKDVLELLSNLLTRYPGARLTAASFQQAGYFNSILVSTLKFMERDSFAGRSKEERVQYLKGLLKILPQFSDRLLRRKVLPAVLELMTDRSLLPFILPNVFHISKNLSSLEFTNSVLPKLKPLFSAQDPPQNMLLLLDQIESLFVPKVSPTAFREEVTPLLYAALEAENIMVQEKALRTVPRLAEILEYAHVKEVLFPKLASLFAKTKVLSVKVNCLICFHAMVSILDKYTLTEKLVPILARIKTKEPSVMVATLAVHEAMANKVDRETLASAIIPQLWVMSMGPMLNAEQFGRFMKAVKEMGERVEKEHTAHLRDVKRMQDHTDTYTGSSANGSAGAGGLGGGVTGIGAGGEIDFATLVGQAKQPGSGGQTREVVRDDKDPFGFADEFGGLSVGSAVVSDLSPNPSTVHTPTGGLTPTHTGKLAGSSISRTISSSNTTSSFPSAPALAPPPSFTRPTLTPTGTSSFSFSPATSTSKSAVSPSGWGSVLQPNSSTPVSPAHPSTHSNTGASDSGSSSGGGPNYNISLSPATGSNWSNPISSSSTLSSFGTTSATQTAPAAASTTTPVMTPGMNSIKQQQQQKQPMTGTNPPGWGGGSVLQPDKPASSNSTTAKSSSSTDAWKDFDPFA